MKTGLNQELIFDGESARDIKTAKSMMLPDITALT